MCRSIVYNINVAINFHRIRLSKALEWYRNEEVSKDLRRCAARIALSSRRILDQLEHYRAQFNRTTSPRQPFLYQIEMGAGKTKQCIGRSKP